jgi:hypothetical protein
MNNWELWLSILMQIRIFFNLKLFIPCFHSFIQSFIQVIQTTSLCQDTWNYCKILFNHSSSKSAFLRISPSRQKNNIFQDVRFSLSGCFKFMSHIAPLIDYDWFFLHSNKEEFCILHFVLHLPSIIYHLSSFTQFDIKMW